MTNIRGPEGPRSPMPSGPSVDGDAAPDLAGSLDRILSRHDTGTAGLSMRPGPCSDPPFDGAVSGRRRAQMGNALAEKRPDVTQEWAGFVQGQHSFATLLERVVGESDSPRVDGMGRLGHMLRSGLPIGAVLSGLGGGGSVDLANPRQLEGEAARQVGGLAEDLVDRLFGSGPTGLAAVLPDDAKAGLRDSAARLSGDDGPAARDVVRSFCLEVVLNRGVLPALLELAAKGDAPAGLPQAVLSLQAVAGGTVDRLSPDLARQLGPLTESFAQRFDRLLSALNIPGFNA